MSSILKALKKIEVQSSPSESFFNRPEGIDTDLKEDSRTRRRRIIRRLITIFLIFLIVFITAFIIFKQRRFIISKIFPARVSRTIKQDNSLTSAGSNIFRAKIPALPATAPQSPLREDRLAKKKMNLTAPASDMKKTPENELSASLGTADNKLNTKKPPSAVSRQKETAPSLKKHLPAKPGLDDREASKKSVAAKSVPSGKPATGAKKPKKIETYDRLKDSKLKLQALAWFVDAPKRIAVINDRIVREGESVDGYQVTEIRPQDVVVNDGTKSWSLEFGLKQ